jgi:hypothetical protein
MELSEAGSNISLSNSDRVARMNQIAQQISYNSATDISHIHRYLCQPLTKKNDENRLRENLEQTNDALEYVCLDINQVPQTSGKKPLKSNYINQLVLWVRMTLLNLTIFELILPFLQRKNQPLEPLSWPKIKSYSVLTRIHQCIKEVIVPSWLEKPHFEVGFKYAGSPKADNYRRLFELYLPLALLSLWKKESSMRADDWEDMTFVLETSMNLSCSAILLTKRTMPHARKELMRQCFQDHLEGLKKTFPGFMLPSHHIGFHDYDSIDLFGPVHNFWCFPGERLIGKFQKTTTNHKPGM